MTDDERAVGGGAPTDNETKAYVTLEKSKACGVGSGPHQTSEGGLRVFCPNCGTENEEAATTCKKCGFSLKGAAAPKFKGTMLMMNAPAG